MRMHIRLHATLLTLCLSLAATAAFAGDGPAAPPNPAAPPPPPDYAVTGAVPSPPNSDEAPVDARQAAEQQRRDAALQAHMDAARQRLEVDAQQLAALSAQMSGPMMQRYAVFAGPPHALIGVQLDSSSGKAGARIREVSPGGPAEQAGVRAGDLIVAVNGTEVRGNDPARHVVQLLRDAKPGDKVDLKVSSDGKTRDLTVIARPGMGQVFGAGPVQLPDMPPLPFKALTAWGGAPMIIRGPVADMELARLTPGLGRYFGTDAGVLVVRAPPDGALGLQDGDVILSIGGRKPIDSSHVIRILGSYDPGEKVTLEVLRLHRKISVATTLPAEPPMPRRMIEIRKGALLGPGPVVTLRGDDRTL